jgi:tRNA (guanine26-N2/guanine27-N2)-dimethyltransferase
MSSLGSALDKQFVVLVGREDDPADTSDPERVAFRRRCPRRRMEVKEGAVEVVVPEQPEDGAGEQVFYNPVQELNRDLTVATLRAYREREPRAGTYLDATAASGIRGVRAAADGWEVTCCDVDPDAVALAARNLARNGLDGETLARDANAVMHERAFDVVDLDPFGTPVPFVDAACRGTRDLLCVTATDLAPLCGAHFDSGVRTYGVVPRNTEYHGEMGVRVLLSALVRTAARYDIAATPLLTHATDHYVRTYLAFDRGATVANTAIDRLGYVHHCQHCLWRTTTTGLVADPPAACHNCGHGIQTAGPVWLGTTCDDRFLDAVGDGVSAELGTGERITELLATLRAELTTPTHYDQHRLCKRWGRSAAAMAEFLRALRDAGHDASRTHYGGTTFKTTASVTEIRDATG